GGEQGGTHAGVEIDHDQVAAVALVVDADVEIAAILGEAEIAVLGGRVDLARAAEIAGPGHGAAGAGEIRDHAIAAAGRHAEVVGARAQVATADHLLGLQVVGEHATHLEVRGLGLETPVAAVGG